jgi:streptomycin 6-kinase
MEKLHQAPLPKEGFPLISDWLSIIHRDWDIPLNYLAKARQLKQKLLSSYQSYVLLHGDLHHDNILLNDNKWQVIDAHGVMGPAIFETWAFIMNIEKDVPFIANRFNYDAREVLEWYFIHLILATCWNLQDNLNPSLFLGLADKTYQLI